MSLKRILLEKSFLNTYPTLEWVQNQLDYVDWDSLIGDRPDEHIMDVKDAYIIGSRAKGTNREDSDIDIGVVVDKLPISSLKLSERYHQQNDLLYYNGMTVDIQFFYSDDNELKTYSKIKLK